MQERCKEPLGNATGGSEKIRSKERSEAQLQSVCFMYHWNTFPEFRGLLHANQNNSMNQIQGSHRKAIGVVAGRPDMEYNFAGETHFFEFKSRAGRMSKKQVRVGDALINQGFDVHVIRDFDTFVYLITRIHEAAKR